MSVPGTALADLRAADVERWLDELELRPLERVDRDGVVAWDLELDGRRRFGLPVTLILDPSVGLLCWAHYAPPIGDMFRKSYRKLLRWNDELPFVKFAIAEDERPILTVELPREAIDVDALGLALTRLIGVSDQLLDESAGWLWLGGRRPKGYGEQPPRNATLLARFGPQLPELVAS
ncbi:MAG TPA: YbjN domain-containing protein [Candidatus Limnocylindrales bacterium]